MELARLAIAVDSRDVPVASNAMDNMASIGSRLEGVVQKVAAAWASWKIVQYAQEVATLAARYETLGVVMGVVGNNAGYTRAQMDAWATSLQNAGISMVESRQSLSVMAQSHIDLANATKLARLAQDAAVIGNMNSSEAFANLIHGIQSGQTEILRTIGINVNFENSYKTLAKELHKNSQDLTELEKVHARTNVVLGKATDLQGAYAASMETAGKQLLSMKRYAEDAQTAFGALFGEAFGVAVQAINQGFIDMKKWLEDNKALVMTVSELLGQAASNFVGLIKDIGSGLSRILQLPDGLSAIEVVIGGLTLAVAVVRDVVNAIFGSFQLIEGTIKLIIGATAAWGAVLLGMDAPDWVKKLMAGGWSDMKQGNKTLGTSYVQGFYQNNMSVDISGDINAAHNKKEFDDLAESRRMASSQLTRDENARAERRMRLEEEAAKHAKDYASELGKQHEEYLKVLGDVEGLYRFQKEQEGYSGKELQNLIERHRIQTDMEKQVKEAAEWERNWIAEQKRAMDDLLKTIENKSQRRADIAKSVAQGQNQFVNSQIGALTAPSRDNSVLAEEIDETNRLYALGIGTLPEYTARMNELNASAHIMTETFGDMRDTVNGWASTLSNDFVDACFGAKFSFSDLITSMLKDLARLAMAQNVTPGLSAWLGSLFSVGSTGASGSSGASSATEGVGGNLMGAYSPSVASPTSGLSVSVQNNITAPAGSSVSQANLDALAGKLQESQKAAALQVIHEEMRPQGLLSRR